MDCIAANKYAADIAKYNEQVSNEQTNAPEQSVVTLESDETKDCLICGEDDAQLLKKLPCKVLHSVYICGACLPQLKDCPYRCGTFNK